MADSRQTLLCTYLSAVLLVGLAVNSLFGWSWADPIAALVIAAVAVKEGRDAWRGDTCCAPNTALHVTVGLRPVPTATTGDAPPEVARADTGARDACGCLMSGRAGAGAGP